jgi:hypothetical protein
MCFIYFPPVTVHHSPPPASQTLNLAELLWELCWTTPDTQMESKHRASMVSKNYHFCPANRPALSPLGANFHPHSFCCNGYGLTQNMSGNKKMVKFGFGVTFLYQCMDTTPFLAGKRHKFSPRRTQRTPYLSFLCRSVLYVTLNY